jgi:hypothetical protein
MRPAWQGSRKTVAEADRRVHFNHRRGIGRPANKRVSPLASRAVHSWARVGSRGMVEDRRISVASAAEFIGANGCRLINWAWRQGAVLPFGVRPGEHEPVEISASERSRIDCATSRVVSGLFTWFQNVTLRWSEVKRLAQVDVELLGQTDIELLWQAADERLAREAGTVASPPPRQDANASVAEAEASALVRALAAQLRNRWSKGRPNKDVDEILTDLREYLRESDPNFGVFEKRTLERAIRIVWPRPKTRRRLAKPRQN